MKILPRAVSTLLSHPVELCSIPGKTTFSSPTKSGQGFTLVELLVVVGIIAILAIAVLAGATSAIAAAKQGVSLAHLRSIGAAEHNYASDHDATFPMYSLGTTTMRTTSGNAANANSPVRKMFTEESPLGGTTMGGQYLDSCDCFYSPLAALAGPRVKDSYYNYGGNQYIGYFYFSYPPPNVGGTVSANYNYRLTDSPNMPRYTDLTTKLGPGGSIQFKGTRWNALYLDGSISSFLYTDVQNLGASALIAKIMQRP